MEAEEEAPSTAHAVRRAPSFATTIVQGVLVLLGLALFLVLLDVLFEYDNPAFPFVSNYARTTWIYGLVGALAILLLIEIVILAATSRRARVVEERRIIEQPPSDAARLLLGCPGCGTVFEHPTGAGNEAFKCPNCGRAGRLAAHVVQHGAQINEKACRKCGNPFQAYRVEAECPVCHERQAMA